MSEWKKSIARTVRNQLFNVVKPLFESMELEHVYLNVKYCNDNQEFDCNVDFVGNAEFADCSMQDSAMLEICDEKECATEILRELYEKEEFGRILFVYAMIQFGKEAKDVDRIIIYKDDIDFFKNESAFMSLKYKQ